jgi:diphthine methyl ester acylhydrolase
MSRTKPFWKSSKLGGGIWRMKWHPYTSNRLLVGAMHGGCCVLNFYGTCLDSNNNDPPNNVSDDDINNTQYNDKWTMKCSKYFTEHESMVYGADWLVCPHPTQNGYFEAAARYETIRRKNFYICLYFRFLYLYKNSLLK